MQACVHRDHAMSGLCRPDRMPEAHDRGFALCAVGPRAPEEPQLFQDRLYVPRTGPAFRDLPRGTETARRGRDTSMASTAIRHRPDAPSDSCPPRALSVPLALDNYRFWMVVVDNTKDRPHRR